MEITLHIGAHRTGTTRLQGVLRRQRAVMAAEGVFFAGPSVLRAARNPGMVFASRLPLPGVRAKAVRLAGAALDRARAQGCARAVLSEEGYAGEIDDILRSGQPYRHIRARLALFAPVLNGHELRICFALRHLADWARSLYAHRAIRRPLPSFESFGAKVCAGRRGWAEVVADIAEALPGARIVLWDYAGMIGRVSEAMRLISGVASVSDPLRHRPPALASASAEAVARLNATRRVRGDREARRALALAHSGEGSTPFRPWSEADYAHLSERYESDFARLRGLPGVEVVDLRTWRAA